MATLNVKPETYERLARKAAARHTTVEELVAPVLEQLVAAESSPPVTEPRVALEEWLAAVQARAGRYPVDFLVDDGREGIYEDRGE